MKLNVNGVEHELEVDSSKPLLWVLREDLGLTGPKFGCGVSACGACTVLLEGEQLRSCVLPVALAENKSVRTIEGLDDELGKSIQEAWIAESVPQCGYCQPGQITAAYALLSKTPSPTDGDIEESMLNICRCGTYPRIRRAIQKAAGGARG